MNVGVLVSSHHIVPRPSAGYGQGCRALRGRAWNHGRRGAGGQGWRSGVAIPTTPSYLLAPNAVEPGRPWQCATPALCTRGAANALPRPAPTWRHSFALSKCHVTLSAFVLPALHLPPYAAWSSLPIPLPPPPVCRSPVRLPAPRPHARHAAVPVPAAAHSGRTGGRMRGEVPWIDTVWFARSACLLSNKNACFGPWKVTWAQGEGQGAAPSPGIRHRLCV